VIEHDLEKLDEWSKKWLMSFNPDKTEIMLFSNMDISEFNFYISTFEEHSGVCKYLTIYFQYVYSI
jgi:hypothetical protein